MSHIHYQQVAVGLQNRHNTTFKIQSTQLDWYCGIEYDRTEVPDY